MASLPGPGLSRLGALRLLPGQRCVRVPRPAPGRAGAHVHAARADPRAPLESGRAPVRGGRRSTLVECPRRSRHPHALLGRPALAPLRGRRVRQGNRRPRRSRRARPFPRGASRPARRARGVRDPDRLPRDGHAVRAWPAGRRSGAHRRRARLAAHRQLRLERRPQQRRPRGARREHLRRLVPPRDPGSLLPRCATSGARRPEQPVTAPSASVWERCWSRAGTASGTGAPTSTTARRSARRRTTRGGSTRWRRPGPFSRARRRTTAPSGPWAPCAPTWYGAVRASSCSCRPPSITPRLEPGYIKGYIPGIRENGGQYTHAAAWVVLALSRLGSGDEAVELFHMLNPINHSRTASQVEQYMTEPYAVAGDVYDHPAHRGRGGWTWYTGSAGWMYRVGLEGILGLATPWHVLHAESLHPVVVADLLYRLALREDSLRDRRGEPGTALPGRGDCGCRWIARRPCSDSARGRRARTQGAGRARRGPRRVVGDRTVSRRSGGCEGAVSRGWRNGMQGWHLPARASDLRVPLEVCQ